MACGQGPGFHADEIPQEKAQIEDLGESKWSIEEKELEQWDVEFESSSQTQTPDAKEAPPKTLAEMAKWVVENESKKVGPACNFFVQRVLYLMGFGRTAWLANDFDNFVQRTFPKFDKEIFQSQSLSQERLRLRDYIWSFPERTGLIIQWERQNTNGHIGIVQRIGNELVLYHASLNKFSPKAQSASIELLLHRSENSYQLNVFSIPSSEFPPVAQRPHVN